MTKFNIKNPGPAGQAVHTTDGIQVVAPETERVLPFPEDGIREDQKASILANGCKIKKVPDSTPVTPFYVKGAPVEEAPDEGMSFEDKKAYAAKDLGLTFGDKIKEKELDARIKKAEEDAVKLDELKGKATEAGVEFADDVTLEALEDAMALADARARAAAADVEVADDATLDDIEKAIAAKAAG